MDKPPRQLLKKAFFGKGNCFKYLLYDDGVVFFHLGKEGKEGWSWKKVKMNDAELGEILLVLEGRKEQASFFHSYGEGKDKQTTQLRINKKEEKNGTAVFIGTNEFSKGLNTGEQRVLEALLQHSMIRMSLQL